MTQHFTRRTVSAEFFCPKCAQSTQHRIDDGHKGPCLKCIDRLDKEHEVKREPAAVQEALFR
jgi:hypothetical protein